jgi:hypothetical protein
MKLFNMIYILLFSFIVAGDIDVLNLKNGDLIKGKIIENKINEYIKIELQGGSILTYTYDQIESIEREEVYQTPVQKSLIKTTSTGNCYQDGLYSGQNVSGGGAMIGGMGSGVLLGLIGWGIAWGVVEMNTPEPPQHEIQSLDTECMMAYRNGYRQGAKKVKRTNVNIGGALGTLLAVIIVGSSY